MDNKTKGSHNSSEGEDDMDLRRGPWTVDEDLTLINYISINGEGRWNSLARCAGLKRTGKSCRLRWLNYLRPDVRRGNITLEEQLMILELHSRWGNRWSKIAQYLPGRTDNEIKNYWRTRVQKHAKQLKCDVNSKQFKDTMRYLWMPRLVERIQAAAAAAANNTAATPLTAPTTTMGSTIGCFSDLNQSTNSNLFSHAPVNSNFAPENSNNSGDSFNTQVSDITDYYSHLPVNNRNVNNQDYVLGYSSCDYVNGQMDYQAPNMNHNGQQPWCPGLGDVTDNLWNIDDIVFLQNQLSNHI